MDRASYVVCLIVVGAIMYFVAHSIPEPSDPRVAIQVQAFAWLVASLILVSLSWPRAVDAGLHGAVSLTLLIPVFGLMPLAALLFMRSNKVVIAEREAAKTPEDRLAEREAALKAREDALKARAEQTEREARLADAARRLDEREARLAELEARSADIKAS